VTDMQHDITAANAHTEAGLGERAPIMSPQLWGAAVELTDACQRRGVHLCPVDAFRLVLLLLQGEQVPRELLLQPLIGIVDAQLLKAAGTKPQQQQQQGPPGHSRKSAAAGGQGPPKHAAPYMLRFSDSRTWCPASCSIHQQSIPAESHLCL